MPGQAKEKITVSIDPRLIAEVDGEVRAHHRDSRSQVVEEAIRLWQVEQKRRAIEAGVEEYYRSRSKQEKQEDRSWSRAAGGQAKRLWDD